MNPAKSCATCRSTTGATFVSTAPASGGSSIPSTLAPGPEQAFAAQMRVKGMTPPQWLVLSASTKARFQKLFGRFGLNLGSLVFSVGGAFGNQGLTLGNTILLYPEFGGLQPTKQLGLLAHEITHSVQYKKLGWISFLGRYRREWKASGGDPYMQPGDPKWESLKKLPFGSVDPVDGRFYLDQLCDRFRVAAESGR